MKTPLVLASTSPRRSEILRMAGYMFEVIPSQFEEPGHSEGQSDPIFYAQEMALEKGKEVFERLEKERVVLSADTVGLVDGEVLEKPKDREDAARMLRSLSGKTHVVITAFAIFFPEKREPICQKIETKVTFKQLSEDEIDSYLNHEEYLDKAAAYAIQGLASVFVEKVEGDYFNVVGLPICQINKVLEGENI